MIEQNKNKTISRLEAAAANFGMAAMMFATIISLTELTDREGHRAIATLQPAYAISGQNFELQGTGLNDVVQMRREREEIRHTSASYGTVMRSHSTTGNL